MKHPRHYLQNSFKGPRCFRAPRGETVTEAGTMGSWYFVLASGHAAVENEEGKVQREEAMGCAESVSTRIHP